MLVANGWFFDVPTMPVSDTASKSTVNGDKRLFILESFVLSLQKTSPQRYDLHDTEMESRQP